MPVPGRPVRRHRVALALLAVAATCTPPDAAARRPPASSEPAVAPRGNPASAGVSPESATLLAAADDIIRQVVALRGLETRRPIQRGVLSREQIMGKLKDRMAKEYTPAEMHIESRFLKRLGLLPADVDYPQLLLGLLQEQVAGFYDPFARRLYIADWLGLELQRPALAHEIEHALQDQHFDIRPFATTIKDNEDRQLARAALVEGDGTAIMYDFVFQGRGMDVNSVPDAVIAAVGRQISLGAMDQSPLYSRAPRFLRETLLFPYLGGVQLVRALRRNHGWALVDEAFKSPPESTSQVMHPEKYFAKQHPIQVRPAAVPSLGPRHELRRDVLGELVMKVLFQLRMADADAERAAAGWAGDRLVVYGEAEEGRPVVVIDLSTWESEEDAGEAEAAMRRVVAPEGAKPVPGIAGFAVERDAEAFAVERRGRDVLAIFGAPADARAGVVEDVWKGWKVAAPDGPRQVR